MGAVAIIPARYAASRLPGKLLLEAGGRSILQHTWERCRESRRLDSVLIATDDPRIQAAALGFGAEVVMTAPDHVSGTDRVAEAARGLDADLILNVQGDEPQIAPEDLDRLVGVLEEDPDAGLATLARAIHSWEDFASPHVVKVVVDRAGRALYFSRATIPCPAEPGQVPPGALKHKGVYAFRRPVLEAVTRLPPAALEQIERLEQLRALAYGHPIQVVISDHDGVEINTPEDYQRFLTGVAS